MLRYSAGWTCNAIDNTASPSIWPVTIRPSPRNGWGCFPHRQMPSRLDHSAPYMGGPWPKEGLREHAIRRLLMRELCSNDPHRSIHPQYLLGSDGELMNPPLPFPDRLAALGLQLRAAGVQKYRHPPFPGNASSFLVSGHRAGCASQASRKQHNLHLTNAQSTRPPP